MKNINTQIQAQQTPNRNNIKKTTPRHIIISETNAKEKN